MANLQEEINKMEKEIKEAKTLLKTQTFRYAIQKGSLTRKEEQLTRAIDQIKRQME